MVSLVQKWADSSKKKAVYLTSTIVLLLAVHAFIADLYMLFYADTYLAHQVQIYSVTIQAVAEVLLIASYVPLCLATREGKTKLFLAWVISTGFVYASGIFNIAYYFSNASILSKHNIFTGQLVINCLHLVIGACSLLAILRYCCFVWHNKDIVKMNDHLESQLRSNLMPVILPK